MIIVCEPVCWGLEHVPFNAALLEIIRLAFPSTDIAFFAEESHLRQVSSSLRSEISASLMWNTISLPRRHSLFLERWQADFKLLRFLLRMLRPIPYGHLVLTCATPATLTALKLLLCSQMHRGKNIQVILHGNVADLIGWRSRNPLIRIQDLRTALALPGNRSIQYIVLEASIRETVARSFPRLGGHWGVLEHPIPPNEGPKEGVQFRPPFRFGFLGMATVEKGFDLFLEVAFAMSMKFAGLVEFHAVGWLEEEKHWQASRMKTLSTKPGRTRMNRWEYTGHLERLHFVCLPYQGRHYEFSPSGVLLDAIGWQKPFIALRVPFIENLKLRFGDIGYVCGNKFDFTHTIQTIVQGGDAAHYESQVLAMEKVRHSRSALGLSCKYKALSEKLASLA